MMNKLRIPLLLVLLWSFLISVASAEEQVYRGAASLGEDELLKAVHVDLSDEEFPSKVMGLVSRAPKLRTLVVAGPRFYDPHLQKLAEIETLRGLVLDSTDVSDAAIAEVLKERPELMIYKSQRWAIERIKGLSRFIYIDTRQLSESHGELRKLLGDRYFQEAVSVDFSDINDLDNWPCTPILSEELAPLKHLTTATRLDLTATRINDAGMHYLKTLTKVQNLRLPMAEVSAAGLVHLRGMADLKNLSAAGVSDDGTQHLAGLQKLEYLSIGSPNLSDAGLEHLRDLPQLASLNLRDSSVEVDGLQYLSALPRLEYIALDDSKLKDLKHISRIRQLKTLLLENTQIDDEALRHFAGCEKLESLSIGKTQIGDAGLAHLKYLPELRELSLQNTQVGDAGLVQIQTLAKLRHLDLRGTRISNAGLKQLRGLSLLQLSIDLDLNEEGIQNLESLTTLRALYLQSTKKGDAAYELALYARLRKALPKCSFNSNEGLYRDD